MRIADRADLDDGLRPALGRGHRRLARPDPASRVAVIGASPRPNHFANTPIANLRRYGFTGEIYPVNPLYREVMGMPCYPSVADLPGIPDLALVVLRQALTVDIVKECAEAGVRAAIVVASGFAETGESDGIALQDALSRVAAEPRHPGLRAEHPGDRQLQRERGAVRLREPS